MIDELGRELSRVGIRGRRRKRILAEFADHLGCNPNADLGEPHALAAQFADELATDSARQTAFATFAALVAVAAAVAIPQLTLPTVPDVTSGRSLFLAVPAGLAMMLGAQVAFAAGCLAALRSLRFGGVPEVALVRRRIAVALVAGATTALGSVLYAVNFWSVVPLWWALLAVGGASGAASLVAGSAVAFAHGGGLRLSQPDAPRGLSADLGPVARPVLIGAAAASAMFGGSSILEGSVIEGALLGGFEACAFVACFVALRRPLALTG